MSAAKLFLSKVDHQELVGVLLSFFGNSSYTSPVIQRYQKTGEADYLDLHFNKYGLISEARFSVNFAQQTLQELSDRIKNDLIDHVGFNIGQCIAFCSDKITGGFNYKNLFQILPVPSHAPSNPYIVFDNPFLIQFSYRKCPNITVDNFRKSREAIKFIRLLHLLSNKRIHLGTRYTNFNWVFNTDNQNFSSEWRQMGYTYNGYSGAVNSFTDLAAIPEITRTPFRDYYSGIRAFTNTPFTLPDNIENSLDLALGLNAINWKKLYLACSWLYSADFIWNESSSSALISLVTAIECLLNKTAEQCSLCRQPKYSVSRKFRDFLRAHFPSIDQFPNEKKLLYKIRSDLAHGLLMLDQDIEPVWQIGFRQSQEASLQWNTNRIVRIAIYNWLWEQSTS